MARIMNRQFEKRYRNGKPICLIPTCNKIAEQFKNGKYRNYCNKHSCHDMWKFTRWEALAKSIIKRDGYKCVKCGDDRQWVNICRYETELVFPPKNFYSKGYRKRGTKKLVSVYNFEVDHIKEVADGGDMWNPDNLQTLCQRCHKGKTKDFLRKRETIKALRRGIQKTLC